MKEFVVENYVVLSYVVEEEYIYLGLIVKLDDKVKIFFYELLFLVIVFIGSFLSYENIDLSFIDLELFLEYMDDSK